MTSLWAVTAALFAAAVGWDRAIGGDWSVASQTEVDVAYGVLGLSVVSPLAALVFSIRLRSLRWIVGSLLVLVVAAYYAAFFVFGIGWERDGAGPSF